MSRRFLRNAPPGASVAGLVYKTGNRRSWLLTRALRTLITFAYVVPSILVVAAAAHDWQELTEGLERRARNTTSILREHALKVISTQELVLDRLDERVAGMSWDQIERSEDAIRTSMKGIATGLDFISSMFLVRPDGRLSISSLQPDAPEDLSDREYFQAAEKNNERDIVIGRPVVGRLSGENMIVFSQRRSTSTGDFDGLVAVGTSPSVLEAFYSAFTDGGSSSVTLVREDGARLVGPSAQSELTNNTNPSIDEINSRSAYYSGSWRDGTSTLYVAQKVGAYPVYVVFGASLTPTYRKWGKDIALYCVVGAISALVLASLSSVALKQAYRTEAALSEWRREAFEHESLQRHYRSLYDKAPIPQQSLDPNGLILNISDRWVKLMGYQRAEAIGRPFKDFIPSGDRLAFEDHWRRLINTGEVSNVHLELLHRSGRHIPVLWSGVCQRDGAGKLIKTLGTLVDETDRRAAERELAQLQKIEVIGQLTAGICHDFNNLLQALSGCLQMLGKRLSEPRAITILEAGHQAISRGAVLTQQLMGFAKSEPDRTEPIDLADLVNSMSELLARALRENIEMCTELDAELWPALADPAKLESAILNLAVNARDAMPDGGILLIKASNLQFRQGSRADGLAGDFVRITVQDTGTGMSDVVLKRAFEPFFTTKAAGKGTGLGLSQVYSFSHQSGGAVEVESHPGQGTEISILLPRSKRGPEARSVAMPNGTVTSLNVLFVEDDPLVRGIMGAILEDLGCEVTRAADSASAIAHLRTDKIFDLLFSDIVMPGGSGIELARRARAERPNLKILLTTGYSDEVIDLQDVEVITKPFLPTTLMTELVAMQGKQSIF